MPGLMILRATLRRMGCCCSATKTRPKPPSPICSISLYGPMVVPTCSRIGSPICVVAKAAASLSNGPSGWPYARSKSSTRCRSAAIASARPLEKRGPLSRVRDIESGEEYAFRIFGRLRHRKALLRPPALNAILCQDIQSSGIELSRTEASYHDMRRRWPKRLKNSKRSRSEMAQRPLFRCRRLL